MSEPLVSIIMGSQSDWETMQAATTVLTVLRGGHRAWEGHSHGSRMWEGHSLSHSLSVTYQGR